MKNITKVITWCLGQLVLALICYILYLLFLEKEFNLELNYIQWLSIIIISQCVIPRNKSEDNKKDLGKFIPSPNRIDRNFKNGKV